MVETSHTSGFWPQLYEPFRTFGRQVADWFAPPSEASSDNDAYQIALEIPGVQLADIDITLQDNVLTIKGEKRTNREEKKDNVYFCERQYGAFQRSFRLPPDAQGDSIDARAVDGVLKLSIPRRAAQNGAHKIEIRSA